MRGILTRVLLAGCLVACGRSEVADTKVHPAKAKVDSLLTVAQTGERGNHLAGLHAAQQGWDLAAQHGDLVAEARMGSTLLYNAVQLDSMDLFATHAPAVRELHAALGDATMLARHLRRMGDAHYRRMIPTTAQAYYDSAVVVARMADAQVELAETFSSNGSLLLDQGNTDEALLLQRRALRILDSIGMDSLPRVRVLGNLGYAYYWAGKADEAIAAYDSALKTLGPNGDFRMRAWNQMNLGSAYIEKGLYVPALEHLQQAYDIHADQKMMFEAAACIFYMAYCQEHVAPPAEVIQSYKRMIAIYDSLGVPKRSMTGHGQLGRYLVDLDSVRCRENGLTLEQRNALALWHCRQGVTIARGTTMPAQLGDLLDGLCDAEHRTGALDSALKHAREAIAIRQAHDTPARTAGSYKDLGMVLHTKGSHREAENAYLTGLKLLQGHSHPQNEMALHDGLRVLYAAIGRYDRAYTHQQQVQRLKDNTLSETQRKDLVQRDLQWKFDRERLADSLRSAQQLRDIEDQRTIAELRAERADTRSLLLGGGGLLLAGAGAWLVILDRKRRRERFAKQAAQLEAKALRAQMDPHFIGNALHAINSYLLVNDARSASDLLSRFAQWMRSTLENNRLDEVPLSDEVETARTYLALERARTGEKFDFSIDLPDDEATRRTPIPTMLIQPLLENAVKHGIMPKSGPGHIRLRIEEKADELVITVEDDGVGREAAAPRNGQRSLSGTITAERLALRSERTGKPSTMGVEDLGPGTRVTLRLPLEPT